jgi:DNA-binding transcriptional regulator YiaG
MVGKVIELGSLVGTTKPAEDKPVAAPKSTGKAKPRKGRIHLFNPKAVATTAFIGQRIRIMREYLKLSRPVLARMLDIPPTTLKNYELGYRNTSLEMIVAIQDSELKAHVMFLITGKTDDAAFVSYIKDNCGAQVVKDLG